MTSLWHGIINMIWHLKRPYALCLWHGKAYWNNSFPIVCFTQQTLTHSDCCKPGKLSNDGQYNLPLLLFSLITSMTHITADTEEIFSSLYCCCCCVCITSLHNFWPAASLTSISSHGHNQTMCKNVTMFSTLRKRMTTK